ncbi:MAG TPA: nucleotidyltransferase domain-containing protein, partial [Geobacteraceae bacterium]|nr:nucleotidyltransferase domain-containing protein [Geobacteraceae bacterium]
MNFDIDRYFPDESYDSGDAGRASFEEKRSLYLAASKHFLNHYRGEIKARHGEGASGAWVVEKITAMSDTLIIKLFQCITSDMIDSRKAGEQLTLVAIGGYGRGELNPCSDIDLMFLHSGKSPQRTEDIAQKLLYFL